MSKTSLLVTLVCFWTLLAILSNIFEVELNKTKLSELTDLDNTINTQKSGISGFFSSLWDKAQETAVLKWLVPLGRIMTFEYTDSIPPALSIFLNATLIFSTYIFISLLRGT